MPTRPTTDQDRLEILEAKRSAIIEAMAAISRRFVAQLADELPERWEEIVRLFISNRPHEAKAQGREGLSRLKSELHRLQDRAHAVATDHLSGSKVWRHLEIDADEGREDRQARGRTLSSRSHPHRWTRVSEPISRAEGEVLDLLNPVFGSGSGLPTLGTVQGRLSVPLEQMLEAYDRLSLQLEEVEAERYELSRKMASEEAQLLWDTA